MDLTARLLNFEKGSRNDLLVGEGGLELRSKGYSTVRSDPGNTDLAGEKRTTVL